MRRETRCLARLGEILRTGTEIHLTKRGATKKSDGWDKQEPKAVKKNHEAGTPIASR